MEDNIKKQLQELELARYAALQRYVQASEQLDIAKRELGQIETARASLNALTRKDVDTNEPQ